MSSLPPGIPIPILGLQDLRQWATDLTSYLVGELALFREVVNSGLDFGDGIAFSGNFRGAWLKDQVTDATPDTETAYTHNLGVVPIGFLVFKRDKAGVIYSGSTAWTTSQLTLRSNLASVTFTALVLPPSTE